MTAEQARVGTRVKTLREFSGVPEGTEGVIDADYGSGVMVAWDLPDRPLPAGYRCYQGGPKLYGPMRDGFDKASELQYLKAVEKVKEVA